MRKSFKLPAKLLVIHLKYREYVGKTFSLIKDARKVMIFFKHYNSLAPKFHGVIRDQPPF